MAPQAVPVAFHFCQARITSESQPYLSFCYGGFQILKMFGTVCTYMEVFHTPSPRITLNPIQSFPITSLMFTIVNEGTVPLSINLIAPI